MTDVESLPRRQNLHYNHHDGLPSYAQAPSDPCAVAYRITQRGNIYKLHCDANNETLQFVYDHKSSKSAPVIILRPQADGAAPFAQASGIQKTLLKQKDIVTLNSLEFGKVPMTLFRGHYCGFRHPSKEIEYYWQLRSIDHTARQFKLKDAVLRTTIVGETSTLTSMYSPGQTTGTLEQDEIGLGRLLIRTDLDGFDKDMALISFIAILARVIETTPKAPFASGLIRALTVGEY